MSLNSIVNRRRLRQLSIPALLIVLWIFFLAPGRSPPNADALDDVPPQEREVPMVDRTVASKLEKLERYIARTSEDPSGDQHMQDLDEVRYLNLQTDTRDAPRVEGIPEPVRVPKPPAANGPRRKLPTQPAELVDAAFCPKETGCRFLFVGFIGEQETKGQQHLYQLGLLATALNRTLVLPNVVRSRLGSCFANPFSYYYAPESLQLLGFNAVMQNDFMQWANTRDPAPTSQLINMALPKSAYRKGAIEIDSSSDPSWVPAKADRKLCLQPPRSWLNFTDFSPIAMFPPEGWHKADQSRDAYGEGVINTLSSPEVQYKASRLKPRPRKGQIPEPDVLVFNYELRYPILSTEVLEHMASQGKLPIPQNTLEALQPFSHFPYAPQWLRLAQNVAAELSPFVAIHWRQETLPTQALMPCTESLISTLRDIARKQPALKTVYLATDYPIEDLESGKEGLVAHSGTFAKLLTEDHHRAMRKLLRAFEKDDVGGLQLTTYERLQQAGRVHLDQADLDEGMHVDLGALDPGLLGIVDKTVAMAAETFLTAVPEVCGKESSFTRQIILDRQARFDVDLEMRGVDAAAELESEPVPGQLWEPVLYWGSELQAQAEGVPEVAAAAAANAAAGAGEGDAEAEAAAEVDANEMLVDEVDHAEETLHAQDESEPEPLVARAGAEEEQHAEPEEEGEEEEGSDRLQGDEEGHEERL